MQVCHGNFLPWRNDLSCGCIALQTELCAEVITPPRPNLPFSHVGWPLAQRLTARAVRCACRACGAAAPAGAAAAHRAAAARPLPSPVVAAPRAPLPCPSPLLRAALPAPACPPCVTCHRAAALRLVARLPRAPHAATCPRGRTQPYLHLPCPPRCKTNGCLSLFSLIW